MWTYVLLFLLVAGVCPCVGFQCHVCSYSVNTDKNRDCIDALDTLTAPGNFYTCNRTCTIQENYSLGGLCTCSKCQVFSCACNSSARLSDDLTRHIHPDFSAAHFIDYVAMLEQKKVTSYMRTCSAVTKSGYCVRDTWNLVCYFSCTGSLCNNYPGELHSVLPEQDFSNDNSHFGEGSGYTRDPASSCVGHAGLIVVCCLLIFGLFAFSF